MCKFHSKWISEFRHISKSEKGDQFAFCKLCHSNFGVFNGGKNDVDRHCKTAVHVANDKASTSTPKVATLFVREDPLVKSATRAEVIFAGFVAEHNISFNTANHFTELVPVLFPDSEIGKKFSSRRTKTTNILTQAIAPELDNRVTELCQKEKFSVMMDESNDKGDSKCVAILVRVLDRKIKKVVTRFLSMPICNIGNAVNLFSCLNEVMIDRELPWRNLVGYASDNSSVMVGKHNSVLSRIREKQPNVYDLGCICHIANTCLLYGLKKLPPAVEELLIDIFYHFKHRAHPGANTGIVVYGVGTVNIFFSSKRKEQYREFLEFTDTDAAKILKHCPTRWLSLDRCVRRTLQQWPALKSYFSSHDESEKRGTKIFRCASSLNDPLLELTFHFLAYILAPLLEFNTAFHFRELPRVILKKGGLKRKADTELPNKRKRPLLEENVDHSSRGSIIGTRRKSARIQGSTVPTNDELQKEVEDWQSETATPGKVAKNRPNFYGAVPGIDVGTSWLTRVECCRDGIHRPTVAGIHGGQEGAYSIALSGGYDDNIDLGNCFTYTGEGGRDLKGTSSNPKNLRTAAQSKDQTLTRGNLALSRSVETGNPVRVIRGYKLAGSSPFAPEEGYRFDGLYTVEKAWYTTGLSGFGVWKFALRRCEGQASVPWQMSHENGMDQDNNNDVSQSNRNEEVDQTGTTDSVLHKDKTTDESLNNRKEETDQDDKGENGEDEETTETDITPEVSQTVEPQLGTTEEPSCDTDKLEGGEPGGHE